MYDPQLVQPFRDELTSVGVAELLDESSVDTAMREPGTTLVFVNSVCGCAAGSARPGLRLSMMHGKKPDRVVTVFAGMEREATARARDYFKPYRPSSPQIALMKDGQLVHMIQRQDIEGKQPDAVAHNLTAAYDEHCS
ncbi:MAG: BrxA/BrxB family bacilliredoxin [bacterium]|nr:BrxA/BrxB family bacilliredoxin [bacterium]